jgi:hypothetical protein
MHAGQKQNWSVLGTATQQESDIAVPPWGYQNKRFSEPKMF